MSKYRGELDYLLPSWDDRKELAELWQQHSPLPPAGLSDATYEALLAVAKWGYEQRAAEEPETWTEAGK